MTQTIDYKTPEGPFGFRNRKTGLTVMGVVLIVMGGLAGCMTILTPLGIAAGRRSSPAQFEMRDAVFILLMYALISAALIWGGIGSIRCRRWIRPLVLIMATLALLTGVITL